MLNLTNQFPLNPINLSNPDFLRRIHYELFWSALPEIDIAYNCLEKGTFKTIHIQTNTNKIKYWKLLINVQNLSTNQMKLRNIACSS